MGRELLRSMRGQAVSKISDAISQTIRLIVNMLSLRIKVVSLFVEWHLQGDTHITHKTRSQLNIIHTLIMILRQKISMIAMTIQRIRMKIKLRIPIMRFWRIKSWLLKSLVELRYSKFPQDLGLTECLPGPDHIISEYII